MQLVLVAPDSNLHLACVEPQPHAPPAPKWCDLPSECILEVLRLLPALELGAPAAVCRGLALEAKALRDEAPVCAAIRRHRLEVWSRRHALLVYVHERARQPHDDGMETLEYPFHPDMDDVLQWAEPMPSRRYDEPPRSYFDGGAASWHYYVFDHRFDKCVGHHEDAAEQAIAAFTRLALALAPRETVRYTSLMDALRAGPQGQCQALVRRTDRFQKACRRYGGDAQSTNYEEVAPVWNGSSFRIFDREDEQAECDEYDEWCARPSARPPPRSRFRERDARPAGGRYYGRDGPYEEECEERWRRQQEEEEERWGRERYDDDEYY